MSPTSLIHFLNVYNQQTMQLMGGIGAIDNNFLLLISTTPIFLGGIYHMKIIIPNSHQQKQSLIFRGCCHWCKPDINPHYYDCCFEVIDKTKEITDLSQTIQRYFLFKDNPNHL